MKVIHEDQCGTDMQVFRLLDKYERNQSLSNLSLPPPPSLSPSFSTERGKTLVQKKPTMFPAWKASFDAHIYEGRVLQVLLMKTAEEPLAEVTVGMSVLAERCKKANSHAEFWVRWTLILYCPA